MKIKKTICTILSVVVFVLAITVSPCSETPAGTPTPTGITSSDVTTA